MSDMKTSSERVSMERAVTADKAGAVQDDHLASVSGGAAKGGRNSVATGKLNDDDLGNVAGGRAVSEE